MRLVTTIAVLSSPNTVRCWPRDQSPMSAMEVDNRNTTPPKKMKRSPTKRAAATSSTNRRPKRKRTVRSSTTATSCAAVPQVNTRTVASSRAQAKGSDVLSPLQQARRDAAEAIEARVRARTAALKSSNKGAKTRRGKK